MFERTLELYNNILDTVGTYIPATVVPTSREKRLPCKVTHFFKNLLSYRRKPFHCFCNQKTGVA